MRTTLNHFEFKVKWRVHNPWTMFFEAKPYFSLSTMLWLHQEFKMTYCFFANILWLYCIYIKWSTIFFFLYNKNERFSRIHSQFRNCFCDNDFLRRESIIFERIQYNLAISLENPRFFSRVSYISRALFHVFCSLEKYLWIHNFYASSWSLPLFSGIHHETTIFFANFTLNLLYFFRIHSKSIILTMWI